MSWLKGVLGLLLAISPATAGGPNILLLIADDLGVANVGAYTAGLDPEPGSPPPTPNLDGLAARGVLFREAWSAPVCSPTRAAIFTGRYGFRTGVQTVSDPLAATETTWAELLSAAGYAHGLFGKWHLGRTPGPSGLDMPRTVGGWDHFEGVLGGAIDDYYAYTEIRNGQSAPVTTYATTEQVNDAIAWIAAQDGPWTCTMAFNAPHTPFHEPPADLHTQNATTNLRRYQAAIEALDTEIGRLLASLGGTLDNTVVIFIGDNGTPGQVIRPPYTTSKSSVYQGGVHVPLIIAGPVVTAPGESAEPVHAVDLFATILGVAGLDSASVLPGVEVDGKSLLGVLADAGQSLGRTVIYTEIVETDPASASYAVRGERYKLVDINGAIELFDLISDPLETSDLLGGTLTTDAEAAYLYLTRELAGFRGLATCPADAALPVNELNIDDVLAFIGAFAAGLPLADLAEPIGVHDIDDVLSFLDSFAAGCPG